MILESLRYVDLVIPENCWEQKIDMPIMKKIVSPIGNNSFHSIFLLKWGKSAWEPQDVAEICLPGRHMGLNRLTTAIVVFVCFNQANARSTAQRCEDVSDVYGLLPVGCGYAPLCLPGRVRGLSC